MKKSFVFILLTILPCGCSGLQDNESDRQLNINEIKKDHPLGKQKRGKSI